MWSSAGWIAVACGVAVTACTQADGSKAVGMVGSPAWMATASNEAKLATYRSNCEGYGFIAGTPEMARCMQEEAGDHRAAASASAIAMSESMRQTGQRLQNVGPTTTTTDCSPGVGGGLNCTSRTY